MLQNYNISTNKNQKRVIIFRYESNALWQLILNKLEKKRQQSPKKFPVHIPNIRDGKWKKMENKNDIRLPSRHVWDIVLADETATNFQKTSSSSRPNRDIRLDSQLQLPNNQIVT